MAHVTIILVSRSHEMLTQNVSPPTKKKECQSSEDFSCEDAKPPLPLASVLTETLMR